MTTKLYCYVDETGQDTDGERFWVAMVFTADERERVRQQLHRIERSTDKRKRKWTKTRPPNRHDYISAILNLPQLRGQLYVAHYTGTTDYPNLIVDGIAKATHAQAPPEDYDLIVFIDGLGKNERRRVGAQLRRRGISIEKVRGRRDESDAFIRVADALAGFARHAYEGKHDLPKLYRSARRRGDLHEL